MVQRIGILVIATIVVIVCLQVSARFSAPAVYSFVSTAEARVGRPMTPASVAGVARRTVRRCAAGVYYC
ncbi:MAG: hypothetical protein ACJ8F3_04160 [Xanthobacteraceae bacterium]